MGEADFHIEGEPYTITRNTCIYCPAGIKHCPIVYRKITRPYCFMATSGATFIINMSRETKNPKKDIPFCIVAGTVVVTLLYIGVGVVAAGVFPVERVAGKNLSAVAKEIFPTPLHRQRKMDGF